MKKLKVMTIIGTRPEIIRLSEVIKKLDMYTDHVLVHTNQNYDYELNQVFFDELKLRKPDHVLNVAGDTVGTQIGNILSQTEEVMIKERPDALLILGDTNSALSCIIAKRMKIPIFHMEAGNRCFDDRVPEEINRRIVDHTSDVNLCYTEHARRNLLREGLDTQYVFVTGSPQKEVYEKQKDNINSSRALDRLKLKKNEYFLVSIHREENVDNDRNFRILIEALNEICTEYDKSVIFSTHPRTRNKLNMLGLKTDKRIRFEKPFGMHDYISLQMNAFMNISDSGTIHEDAAILGIPAITVRESNERPEAYDTGNVIMTGVDKDMILNAIKMIRNQLDNRIEFATPPDYDVDNVSDKIARLILKAMNVKKKKYHL